MSSPLEGGAAALVAGSVSLDPTNPTSPAQTSTSQNVTNNNLDLNIENAAASQLHCDNDSQTDFDSDQDTTKEPENSFLVPNALQTKIGRCFLAPMGMKRRIDSTRSKSHYSPKRRGFSCLFQYSLP